MPGKVIGKTLNHGFAGKFARTPDSIIPTRVAEGEVVFGDVLMRGTAGLQVKKATASLTTSNFVGIAGSEVKSALDYANQGIGKYADKAALPVVERGSVNVECANGTPALGGAVYVAITTSAWTGALVGQIGAAVTGTASTDYITLTNAQWGGEKDANNIAELVLLTRANV